MFSSLEETSQHPPNSSSMVSSLVTVHRTRSFIGKVLNPVTISSSRAPWEMQPLGWRFYAKEGSDRAILAQMGRPEERIRNCSVLSGVI